ncbi:autotransporter outer membrane beta-barrel domain-containing protein [Tropicimonas sp. IMCC34043]|uniref:autotransporter family protein n=1 Tax=Tropicimonas sp. IMCC34043 TaxID=2248760 RepID=UPI0018E51D5E|nr:autotransporter outer membrane beta-barrel domain-containing protein [Tropicimonas sp. IMCC34043]
MSSYETLTFGETTTFLTGIRGDNVVGNYVIPGTTATGGLYYNLGTQVWAPMPVATEDGVNFPGAISSSPYGPSFGTPAGILRTVGSYQTEDSAPNDLSYIYDGAAAPGEQIKDLIYPDRGAKTLFTIAHSTFGNRVVGNYDTEYATGNAFIYEIDSGQYINNNIPDAISTTAYGIYGDKISGGYFKRGERADLEHGYIYDLATGTYTTYDHPLAIATHFEGITGAGTAGAYNLVTNWITADLAVHPAVMHVAADGTVTWYEIDVPGEVVSANSAYGDKVIGIYILDGVQYGYVATIPGIYNPIRNLTPLVVSSDNATGIVTQPGGDDVVNHSTILVEGRSSVGIKGETYGVITNDGTITATGLGSAGVRMNGTYGTLLNAGTLIADPGADAIVSGPDARGTMVVNEGTIDGRVNISAGPETRFENSGWLGVSAPGAGTVQQISGTYAQTDTGTLSLRIDAQSNDMLQTDLARLDGTLAARFQSDVYKKTYTLVTANQDITGTFATLETPGLPDLFVPTLGYSPTEVTLNVSAGLARLAGNTDNGKAVGAAIDSLINTKVGNILADLPSALDPLYRLDANQLPGALDALSGEGFASEQSVLIGDSLYGRLAILGRLRQATDPGQNTALTALSRISSMGAEVSRSTQTAGTAYPGTPMATGSGSSFWAQGFGGWNDLDGSNGTYDVSETVGGIILGADTQIDNWTLGAAFGFYQSNSDVDELSSSFDADSQLLGIYAGTAAGPFSLRFGANYIFSQIDSERTISLAGTSDKAKADYDARTAQAFAEIGYGVALRDIALEPFAGLAWVNVDTDSFTESGADAGLKGSSSSSDVGYGTIGVRAATNVELSGGKALIARGSLAWQNAFGDLTPQQDFAFNAASGSDFTVSGVPLAENTALVELGIDVLISRQGSVGISYVGQFAEDVSSSVLQADVTWRF